MTYFTFLRQLVQTTLMVIAFVVLLFALLTSVVFAGGGGGGGNNGGGGGGDTYTVSGGGQPDVTHSNVEDARQDAQDRANSSGASIQDQTSAPGNISTGGGGSGQGGSGATQRSAYVPGCGYCQTGASSGYQNGATTDYQTAQTIANNINNYGNINPGLEAKVTNLGNGQARVDIVDTTSGGSVVSGDGGGGPGGPGTPTQNNDPCTGFGCGGGSRAAVGTFDLTRNASCEVAGWAYDPDNPATSIEVHVYRDGQAGSGGTFVTNCNASRPRPDVNSAFSIPGNHGFDCALPTNFHTLGTRNLYIHAIDVNGAPNNVIDGSPKSITCTPPPPPRIPAEGFFDRVDDSQCRVAGWALDRDNLGRNIPVHIYRDGPAGSGTAVASCIANQSRTDLNSVMGVPGNYGFNCDLPTNFSSLGARNLYIHAIDLDATGPNNLLGGVPKTIDCSPQPTPTPPPVTGLSGSCAAGTIDLSWNPSTGASDYLVRIDNLSNPWNGTCNPATVNAGDSCGTATLTTYSTPGLDGATYRAWLSARNSSGVSNAVFTADFTCAGTPTPPPPVTGLSASCPAGTIELNWLPASSATNYQVRIDDLSNSWNGTCNPASINPGDSCDATSNTSYSVTGNPGATYRVWIRSENSVGMGAQVYSADFTCGGAMPVGPADVDVRAVLDNNSPITLTNPQTLNQPIGFRILNDGSDQADNTSYTLTLNGATLANDGGLTIPAGNSNPYAPNVTWVPTGTGNYTLEVCANHPNDADLTNNCDTRMVVVSASTGAACNNGVNDDTDSFTDADDPGCHTDGDASGNKDPITTPNCNDCTYDPTRDSENDPPTIQVTDLDGNPIPVTRQSTEVIVDWNTNGNLGCVLSNNLNAYDPYSVSSAQVEAVRTTDYTIDCAFFDPISVRLQVIPRMFET